MKDALIGWRLTFRSPFFLSAVLEASPAIMGHRLIGFGAAFLVVSEFMDREIDSPCPDFDGSDYCECRGGARGSDNYGLALDRVLGGLSHEANLD